MGSPTGTDSGSGRTGRHTTAAKPAAMRGRGEGSAADGSVARCLGAIWGLGPTWAIFSQLPGRKQILWTRFYINYIKFNCLDPVLHKLYKI
jgi:hypothetical protein